MEFLLDVIAIQNLRFKILYERPISFYMLQLCYVVPQEKGKGRI